MQYIAISQYFKIENYFKDIIIHKVYLPDYNKPA